MFLQDVENVRVETAVGVLLLLIEKLEEGDTCHVPTEPSVYIQGKDGPPCGVGTQLTKVCLYYVIHWGKETVTYVNLAVVGLLEEFLDFHNIHAVHFVD
jgi:hypothetical protein